MNELIINTVGMNNVQYKNKKLQNATMQIFRIGDNIRQKWFEVGAIIALVDAEECYKEDGFESVHEWVQQAFKLKKSRSYDLLKIGREYTRAVLSASGKVVGYECNLLPESTKDNFNSTQVTRMLPLGHEIATQFVEDGKITPSMTATAIKKVVDEYTGKDKAESTDITDSADNTDADKEQVKLRKIFDNISTSDLIAELNKRGFYVYDESGKEVKPSESKKGGEDE